MAVAITASLTGATTPQKVSVVVSGMVSGDTYQVSGVWSGGSWDVRGGAGTSDGSQVVLGDLAAPVNVPVTYQVVATSGNATSGSVTVSSGTRWLLQSLEGESSASFALLVNGTPRSMGRRASLLQVSGRRDPVAVTNVALCDSGALQVKVTAAQEADLRQVLADGRPLLFRSDGSLAGLPATDYIVVTDASAAGYGAGSSLRAWSLSYQVIGDPEPNTRVPLATWDNFDSSYALSSWSSFDTEWAGLTWDLFDRTDWTTH